MPLTSVEGLLISLLFLVPGGLGLRVRRHVYSQPAATAFWEALSALAASLLALLALEIGGGLVGLLTRFDLVVGNQLVEPLLFGINKTSIPWEAYFAYFGLALVLPLLGSWAVRTRLLHWLRAPSAHGLEYLVDDVRPKEERKVGPWVTVTTTNNDTFFGWLMWKSTPPDPFEVVLGDVTELSDPDSQGDPNWALWLPADSISSAWVNVGAAAHSLDAPEASEVEQ